MRMRNGGTKVAARGGFLLLVLTTVLYTCTSRPAPPQPFVSSILPTATAQISRPTAADVSPLPTATGPDAFIYGSVAELLARRPPPGQTVQVDAYYSRYIVRSSSGPAPLPDQIVCMRFPAWLSDAPATECEALGDDRSCSKPPPAAAYVFLLQASQIGPGRVPMPPALPHHARYVGHLGDPIVARCPDADKIFILERVAEVYQDKPFPVPPPPTLPASTTPTPLAGSTSDYSFGAATVVLTSTGDIDVSTWLPDSQRLLITRSDTEHPGGEFIETFDVGTGQLQRYGQRRNGLTPPVWLPGVNKVAYTGLEGQGNHTNLWVAGVGGSGAASSVVQDVWPDICGFDDSVLTVVRVGRRLLRVNDSGQAEGGLGLDLAVLGLNVQGMYAGMASYPDKHLAAIYENPHLVIVNASTGALRKIDLGQEASEYKGYGPRWVVGARWSPDSRYLAMETSVGQPVLRFSDLRLLDVQSGHIRFLQLPTRYVTDIAWAPDSRSVAVLGQGLSPDIEPWRTLYLVNTESGEVRPILPGTTFGTGPGFASLAWSPDGRTIVVRCPTPNEGRLCAIPVSR